MRIFDLLFPQHVKCIFCGDETPEIGICNSCYEKLPFLKPPVCEKCGGKNNGKGRVCYECKGKKLHFDKCYSVLEYSGDVQKSIISFKQVGNKYIGETFAHLIERKFKDIDENIDIIIPVPISENRLKEREFNQSAVLCCELPKDKLEESILKRIKDTPHQTGLTKEYRETNLIGAFEVSDKNKIKNKTILLVDDVYTTGSTLDECAKTLLKGGAQKVIALCLARTPVRLQSIIK